MQRVLAAEEARRESRRALRQARRAERRRRSPTAGVGMLFAAAGVLAAVVNGAPYWLAFVAMWFAFIGVRRLVGKREAATVEGEMVPEPDSVDARMARVDALCDQLLADIQDAPPVLREVVHRPEETVRALREGVHALERREREIRALTRPEDDARLQSERDTLQKRLGAEQDAVTRQRLAEALEALDGQRAQRASLVTAASGWRPSGPAAHTLEGLHTQVLAVRSTAEAARRRWRWTGCERAGHPLQRGLRSGQRPGVGAGGGPGPVSAERPAAGRSSVAERG